MQELIISGRAYLVFVYFIALFFPKGLYGLVGRFLPENRRKPQWTFLLPTQSPHLMDFVAGGGHLPRVESAWKSFGGVQALSAVSLDVNRGMSAVIGPNGSVRPR
jgi:hypothetical protein